MLLNQLDYKLKNYRHLPRREKMNALHGKITHIASYKAFGMTMFKIGIDQSEYQHAHQVLTDELFNHHKNFKLNNKIPLNKDTVVFFDKKDQEQYDIPKNKTVEVYTRRKKVYAGYQTYHRIEVAYVLDGKVLVINPRDGEMTPFEKERHTIN